MSPAVSGRRVIDWTELSNRTSTLNLCLPNCLLLNPSIRLIPIPLFLLSKLRFHPVIRCNPHWIVTASSAKGSLIAFLLQYPSYQHHQGIESLSWRPWALIFSTLATTLFTHFLYVWYALHKFSNHMVRLWPNRFCIRHCTIEARENTKVVWLDAAGCQGRSQ